MARPVFKEQSKSPYHITARCINREWFGLPLETVWEVMQIYLYFIHHSFQIQIHSFVLMPNHFHLIASSPKSNLSSAMAYFMCQTSRQITFQSRRINQTYGQRFHRSEIQGFHYFLHAYKYVYRNPVKAGLCKEVETYPFSTLHGLLGKRHLLIPLSEDRLIFSGKTERTLDWLNQNPEKQDIEDIRRALRRTKFKLPTRKNQINPLEEKIL